MELLNQIGVILAKIGALFLYVFLLILSPTGAASASGPPDFELFKVGNVIVSSIDAVFLISAIIMLLAIELPQKPKMILGAVVGALTMLFLLGILPSLLFNICIAGVMVVALIMFFKKPLNGGEK